MLMRIGTGALLCLLMIKLKVNYMMIDLTNYAIPEDYMVYMLIASIVLGFLAAITLRAYDHNKAADNKAAKGSIPDTNSLPYDKRYDAMTIAALIVSIGLGMYVAPAAVDAIFINAGAFIYAAAAAILTGIFVWIVGYIFHFGVQKTIIDVAKYAVSVTQAAKDAMGDIQQAINNVNEIKKN